MWKVIGFLATPSCFLSLQTGGRGHRACSRRLAQELSGKGKKHKTIRNWLKYTELISKHAAQQQLLKNKKNMYVYVYLDTCMALLN